jgi:hypothetical protein
MVACSREIPTIGYGYGFLTEYWDWRCGLAGQRSECNHKPFTDNYTRSKDNINTPARDSALAGDLCIYQQEDHPQPRFTVLVRQDTARHHHHKPLWRQYMVCGLGCVPALQQGSSLLPRRRAVML